LLTRSRLTGGQTQPHHRGNLKMADAAVILAPGQTVPFQVQGFDQDGNPVPFTSDDVLSASVTDDSVATVTQNPDGSGEVTAVSGGSATLVVTDSIQSTGATVSVEADVSVSSETPSPAPSPEPGPSPSPEASSVASLGITFGTISS
jgi:hypothetical protein